MAITDALALLKIAGPLVAMVPVFGPQLEALINVANELCGVAEVRVLPVSQRQWIYNCDMKGIQSNREGFVSLAQDAATYAAAVAETVQKSHSPVPSRAIPGPCVLTDQITPIQSTSPAQVHYVPTHVAALTEYVVKSITSEKQKLILNIVQDAERDRECCLCAQGKRCCKG